ncbi:pentapeptide repeat-containing protein [Nocardia asiatica]
MTVVAGVGGVVALVIAYRRQRDLEQSRFVERFGAAAAQLGATDVAVRIAGVYAMAGVADEADGLRRQQCIDVLCGYLRLPYDAEHGASGRTKLVVKAPRVERGRVRGEIEEHVEYRQNDREVRATIVRVIADHLRIGVEYSWSTSDFDFRTAYLEDVDFSDADFSGVVRFSKTTVNGNASFDRATFRGNALFPGTTFKGKASFDEATIGGNALFEEATISDASFREATIGDASFDKATISDASFSRADFGGYASFDEATIGSQSFGGGSFNDTNFSSNASFRRTTFGAAEFRGATFNGSAEFSAATFHGNAEFSGTTFHGNAWFGGKLFATVTFSSYAWFRGATFCGEVSFEQVVFAGLTTFLSTDFGSGRVLFVNPRQWGPPPPEFDWGENGDEKPTNIEPADWPPTPAVAV